MGLLGWAFTFLVVALVAALFGFSNIAVGAVAIARVLFGIFLLLFLLLLVLALVGVGAVVASGGDPETAAFASACTEITLKGRAHAWL